MDDTHGNFGRVAIVTGAAQGLGLAIALRLANDGLDVVVNDILGKEEQLSKVNSEISAKGRRSLAIVADVSSEEQVTSMISRVVDELGGLDVMVANAGVAIRRSFIDTTLEDWERILAINLRGVMLCYKHAALQMIKQGRGGRIVGASSVAGKRGGPNLAAYTASKFAVRGLTQTAAQELAQHRITVNTYAPGFIITDLANHPEDQANGLRRGATIKKIIGYKPDDPEGTPEDVAAVVSFLVRSDAQFITGQSLNVDGGIIFD